MCTRPYYNVGTGRRVGPAAAVTSIFDRDALASRYVRAAYDDAWLVLNVRAPRARPAGHASRACTAPTPPEPSTLGRGALARRSTL